MPNVVQPLRVLVSAYACSPRRGSEHAVGWGFIHALAQRHHLCVIAEEEKCRADIESHFEKHPELRQRIEFHFVRKQRGRLLRKLWPPSYYYYYKNWHQEVFRLAQRLHAESRFDLVHQLTMVGYREPGYLWKLGAPFVWGPIGGMGHFPWRFLPSLGMYGLTYFTAYNLINAWQERYSLRPRLAANLAGKALIAATPVDQAGTLRHWRQPSHLIAEVGLPSEVRAEAIRRGPEQPLRVVWSGLHIPRKALPLGLRALAELPSTVDWTLDVLGRGTETAAWQKLAQRLGIAARCRFHGWIEREQALETMRQGHVMLITSLRDLTSTVTVEALAQGLPVVCLDHCGFSAAIDDTCGIKVSVTNPKVTITGLRNALLALNDESVRFRLAHGALTRAQDFSWSQKAEELDRIYRYALESAAS